MKANHNELEIFTVNVVNYSVYSNSLCYKANAWSPATIDYPTNLLVHWYMHTRTSLHLFLTWVIKRPKNRSFTRNGGHLSRTLCYHIPCYRNGEFILTHQLLLKEQKLAQQLLLAHRTLHQLLLEQKLAQKLLLAHKTLHQLLLEQQLAKKTLADTGDSYTHSTCRHDNTSNWQSRFC